MNYATMLRIVLGAWLSLNATLPMAGPAEDRAAYLAKVEKAKALFKEKCATVAREKIYRKVENVEGILLLKVRPQRGDRQLSDPMWPGAAFAGDSRADNYITDFLAYEYAPGNSNGKPGAVTPERRGYINTDKRPGGRPGYRWVEVVDEQDGKRYRYTGSNKAARKKDTTAYNVRLAMSKDPNYDLNVYQWSLDKSLAPKERARYAVTYEDHVIPEERGLWVASGTIKVLDLKTNEVLGELTRYAINFVHTPSSINPAPWLTADFCPLPRGMSGSDTRKFVDQILIPAKEQ